MGMKGDPAMGPPFFFTYNPIDGALFLALDL
jgi:hypothetical protein